MNETNFKVGDRVIGLNNSIGYKIKNVKGTVIYANYISTCVEFDEDVNGHSGGIDGLNGKLGHCVYVGTNVRLLNESSIKEEIIIYNRCNEVVAMQKRDGKFVDSAKAKCNSTDEFAFLKGAEIAFDRLIGKDEEVKEVKRVAELGEYVRVTSTDGNGWEKDSIHKVTGHGTGFPEWVYVDGMNRGIIRINQYVVLESYKPQKDELQEKEIAKLKEQIEKQKELIIEKNKLIESLNNTQRKKAKDLIEQGCPVHNGFNKEYCGDMSCKECWLKAIETEILDEEE